MATTSPDNLRTPDPGDPYNLVADLAVLANDVQDALIARGNVFRGTAAQRVAFLSTASAGMLWQDTDDIEMLWKRGASQWVPAVWHWSGTTAQMNGFTQAPNGFEWYNTTDGNSYARISGAWVNLYQKVAFPPDSGTLNTSSTIQKNTLTGVVTGLIAVTRTAWTTGGATTLGTIPVDFRPPLTISVAVALNGAGSPYVTFGQITLSGVFTVHNSPPNGQSWMASATFAYAT